ncbi:hypothetical protein ACNKHR_14055 [Shigella flexneri]
MLTRPEAPFLADLAMDFASILSKEYADAMTKAGTPEKLDLNPIELVRSSYSSIKNIPYPRQCLMAIRHQPDNSYAGFLYYP